MLDQKKKLNLESEKFEKASRALKAFMYTLRYPSLFASFIKPMVTSIYAQGKYKRERLQLTSSEKTIQSETPISLLNCTLRDGNVSYLEMLILCSFAKRKNTKTIVEIGTYDGNTTLQLALNANKEATVHTIDLPDKDQATLAPVLGREIKYILDKKKSQRKYLGTTVEKKVVQHFGDSTKYDFQKFCQNGLIDLCFIDGSHSYSSVKLDTENALKWLSPNGTILWHDYNPNYQGVYRYLNELSKTHNILLFENTSLAVFSKKNE